jgi:polyisoprenoid-binding protein YceI
MIRTIAAACVLAISLAGAALAAPSTTDPAKVPAGTYVLDKKHASLTVKIVHMGL